MLAHSLVNSRWPWWKWLPWPQQWTKKIWQVPQLNWHVSLPIWAFLCPQLPILPVKIQFSQIFPAPGPGRPLSVWFLFLTSGKQTDTATPLSMEKFGRINFSLARWVTEGKKRPNRWGNMPIELWDLSEFFFIHCCGRGSHFSKGHPSTCWKKY